MAPPSQIRPSASTAPARRAGESRHRRTPRLFRKPIGVRNVHTRRVGVVRQVSGQPPPPTSTASKLVSARRASIPALSPCWALVRIL